MTWFLKKYLVLFGIIVQLEAKLYAESRCNGESLVISDKKTCPQDTRLLPRKIILGYNENSSCISRQPISYWHEHPDLHSLCCSPNKGDCNKTFHLPADDNELLQTYKTFLTLCSSARPELCSIKRIQVSSLHSPMCFNQQQDNTYTAFVYECINETTIGNFIENMTLSSTNPHLILNGVTGTTSSECVAYTNCTSNILVSVADVVLENTSSCSLSVSDGRTNFSTNTCLDRKMYKQPIFYSNGSYARLTLKVNTSKTSEQLWVETSASNHGIVTVACGMDAFNFSPTVCTTRPTTRTATATNVNMTTPSKSITSSPTHFNTEPGTSITTKRSSTTENISKFRHYNNALIVPIIVLSSIGAAIIVVGLIAAINCYRRRNRGTSLLYKHDHILDAMPSATIGSTKQESVFFENNVATEAHYTCSISDDEKINRASTLVRQTTRGYEYAVTESPWSDTLGMSVSNPYDHFGEENTLKFNPDYDHMINFNHTVREKSGDYSIIAVGPVDTGYKSLVKTKSSKFQMSRNKWVLEDQNLADIYSAVSNNEVGITKNPSSGTEMMSESPSLRTSVEEGLETTRTLDAVLKAEEEDEHAEEDIYAKVIKKKK